MLREYFGGGAALWLALTAAAWAQEAPPTAGEVGPASAAAPPANEAVDQFDADGDGRLLGEELARARDFLRALRGVVGDRPRDVDAPREGDGDRPPRERGGRGGRGDRGRRGGPPPAAEAPPFEIGDGDRPPRPEAPPEGEEGPRPPRQRPEQAMRLFREFDDNDDGQLNREEFTALMGALRERRGPGAGGPPGGDELGPPERPEGRRRFGGDGGGPPRGRRGGGDLGPPRGDGRPPRGPEGDRGFDGPPGPPEARGGEGAGGPPRGSRRMREGGQRPPREAGEPGQADL